MYQVHFDRDFASIGELLDIPLCGPGSLTTLLDESRQTPLNQVNSANTPPLASIAPSAWSNGAGTTIGSQPLSHRPTGYGLVAGAIAKFLAPEPTTATSYTAGQLDNSWYRLLGFLEVPTKMHRQLGNPIDLERVPGAINLNMLRHPSVLAALIDDAQIADLAADGDLLVQPGVVATGSSPSWFWNLVQSRDGAFVSTTHTVWIPGWAEIDGDYNNDGVWAKSNPIRSLSRITPTPLVPSDMGSAAPTKTTVVEESIFRSTSFDVGAADPRRLFEIGTAAQHTSGALANDQDSNPMLRHRILSKILNNSTNTSNVFVIYLTIGHFEAIEDANGAVRIGGEYDLNGDGTVDADDRKRALFIVDRSEAFEAYDPGTGTFDWRRLVKHRVDIR